MLRSIGKESRESVESVLINVRLEIEILWLQTTDSGNEFQTTNKLIATLALMGWLLTSRPKN